MKLGLIIDLTNTNRFYDADSEVKSHGIKYVKLSCKGYLTFLNQFFFFFSIKKAKICFIQDTVKLLLKKILSCF